MRAGMHATPASPHGSSVVSGDKVQNLRLDLQTYCVAMGWAVPPADYSPIDRQPQPQLGDKGSAARCSFPKLAVNG